MENLTLIKPEKVQNIINKFCYTIGMIPTSYKVSLTYEEQIIAIGHYLEETVIPALNNNAEAVAELQSLFVQLKDYVENYFTNLDVQEEINNKLDQMVATGELQNLLNLQYDELRNEVNEDIEEIRNVVTNVASGSPLVASSTSEMTNTSRIYINTTDGKWYYYNGTNWQIGGDYQSSGISNNSISIYKLDDLLQSNFDINYSKPLELGTAYTGYYKNDGTITENESFINFHYNLVNGKKYIFNGYDSAQAQSIIIKDNSNNLIYVSNPNNQIKNECLIFECNENNLTAYMSVSKKDYEKGSSYIYNMFMLRELTNIYNNLKYNSNIPEIKSFIGYTRSSDLSLTPPSVNFNLIDTEGEVKFYQMNKGCKYKINAWNHANICGLVVVDNYKNIIYASSTSNIGPTRTEFNYEFTAEDDGIIILTTYQPNVMPTSIKKINNNIEINLSVLNEKSITFNGDSICASNNGGYGKIIADMFNMKYQNIAVGGATIIPNTYSGDIPRHWISNTINNMDISDYAILEGGVNDSSLGLPLGTISNGYDAELNTSTYYGAFENMLKQLIKRFAGKKYGYIAVHQMTPNYRIINDPSTSYYYASKNCCEKWGVPFLDLNDKVPPFAFLINTSLSSLPTTYTKDGDGWHPNELGYKKYYVDKIVNWLESL